MSIFSLVGRYKLFFEHLEAGTVFCVFVEKQWDCAPQKLTAPLVAPEGAGGVEILG